jgi:flagellar export protein FliJ
MKKFQFSMQKVLEYDTHREDSEKVSLEGMRTRHRALRGELESLYQQYAQYERECDERCAGGVALKEMISIREYMEELKRQMVGLLPVIEGLEREIEEQIGKIVTISREKSSLEKLRERHFALYEQDVRKTEETLIGDFLANAKIVKGMPPG